MHLAYKELFVEREEYNKGDSSGSNYIYVTESVARGDRKRSLMAITCQDTFQSSGQEKIFVEVYGSCCSNDTIMGMTGSVSV